jgi:hypothetical protein
MDKNRQSAYIPESLSAHRREKRLKRSDLSNKNRVFFFTMGILVYNWLKMFPLVSAESAP